MSTLGRRSVTSVSWNVAAQAVIVGVGFVRSILLARMLDVETFGIYAGATAIIAVTSVVADFGMGGAYLHRAPETQDEEAAAAQFLTLRLFSMLVWVTLMLAAVLHWAHGPTLEALVVITITFGIEMLVSVPVSVLIRRVEHKRTAILGIINVIVVAIVTVGLAWRGTELWSLLAGEVVTTLILVVGLFIWRPPWRARLRWNRAEAAYFVRFGVPVMAANFLETSIQRVDDLFVRFRLGVLDMGFYSRAYTFASYPRAILSAPVAAVAGGTFAEVAENRLQLSKAFFRTSALLVRAGFLFAGWLVLIAPEFVALLLGPKWLPMVPIFRLMSVFALIDPLRDLLTSVYVAVGQPRRLMRFKLIQLLVLVAGLLLLGRRWGTVGVALAVDLMLIFGIAQLMLGARSWVDFSLRRLFAWPLLALAGAGGAALLATLAWGAGLNLWLLALLKSLLFCAIYAGLLWLGERRSLLEMWATLRAQMAHA